MNGPSMIRTLSPRSNVYFGFGFSFDSLTWSKIWSTSSWESGVGWLPVPTKPVTLGVFLTRCQVESGIFFRPAHPGLDLDQDVAGEELGGLRPSCRPSSRRPSRSGSRMSPIWSSHAVGLGALAQALRHLLLEARVGVDDVPLLRRRRSRSSISCAQHPREDLREQPRSSAVAGRSRRRRVVDDHDDRRRVTSVPAGQVTFFSSVRTSRKKISSSRSCAATTRSASAARSASTVDVPRRSLLHLPRLCDRHRLHLAFDSSPLPSGRPGGTRTPNPRFWRPVLYH